MLTEAGGWREGLCRDVRKEPTDLVNGQVEKVAKRWDGAESWDAVSRRRMGWGGE